MKIDYDKLAKERFTGTNIQDFHQITALSQKAINEQMKVVHALSPKDSPLKNFVTDPIPGDDWSGIVAVLGPPKIELLFETEFRIVLYTVSLESGFFKYWTEFHGGDKVQSPIENWKLVFKVNLDLKALDKDQQIPDYVKKTLKVLDDYSIHQLLVDLNTADVMNYRQDLSVIKLENDFARYQFVFFFGYFLKLIKDSTKRDHSIIHYLPRSKNPKDYPIPTLPPTDLNFQNLPFVASDAGTGDKDDNMLIYLQMTENVPLPYQPLLPSANWVVPVPPGQAGYDGTVALSKKVFLEGWLLPKLELLNRLTSFVADEFKMDYIATPFPVWYCSKFKWHAGFNDGEEPTKGPWTYNSAKSDNDYNVYDYTYHSKKDDDSGPAWVYGRLECETENTLKIPVGFNRGGKCVIEISGKTETYGHVHTAIFNKKPDWTATWSAEIILDGVDHASLQIKTELTHEFKGQNEGDFPQETEAMKGTNDKIKELLTKLSTEKVGEDMKEVLEGSWSFVFAGASDFFFDKAAFNKAGDLLAQLKYNTHSQNLRARQDGVWKVAKL